MLLLGNVDFQVFLLGLQPVFKFRKYLLRNTHQEKFLTPPTVLGET